MRNLKIKSYNRRAYNIVRFLKDLTEGYDVEGFDEKISRNDYSYLKQFYMENCVDLYNTKEQEGGYQEKGIPCIVEGLTVYDIAEFRAFEFDNISELIDCGWWNLDTLPTRDIVNRILREMLLSEKKVEEIVRLENIINKIL